MKIVLIIAGIVAGIALLGFNCTASVLLPYQKWEDKDVI